MGSTNCMSLALPGITGAEICELFGIILGLLEIVQRRHFHDSAVLTTCDRYVACETPSKYCRRFWYQCICGGGVASHCICRLGAAGD